MIAAESSQQHFEAPLGGSRGVPGPDEIQNPSWVRPIQSPPIGRSQKTSTERRPGGIPIRCPQQPPLPRFVPKGEASLICPPSGCQNCDPKSISESRNSPSERHFGYVITRFHSLHAESQLSYFIHSCKRPPACSRGHRLIKKKKTMKERRLHKSKDRIVRF